MAKKKLLILLGAGSSVAHRMPSVADLDKAMLTWAEEWHKETGAADNYFQKIWDNSSQYSRHEVAHEARPLNFEQVLGDTVELANWLKPPPFGNPIRRQMENRGMPAGIRFASEISFDQFFELNSQIVHLMDSLAKLFRGKSIALDDQSPAFSDYRRLFLALREQFDVGIFNLNYDNVALRASLDAFTGFDDRGVFDPDAVHTSSLDGFIYHMHGSVHHSLIDHESRRVRWESDLAKPFLDAANQRKVEMMSEGKLLPRTTLIAGRFKLDQLLGEPYSSFYGALIKQVYSADAVILGGYGFGDPHVNQVLRNWANSTKRAIPSLILTKSNQDDQPILCRKDRSTVEFRKVFGIDTQLFTHAGRPKMPVVIQLILRENSFEVSAAAQPPIAFWHGGFHEAVFRMGPILSWLDGDRTALGRC